MSLKGKEMGWEVLYRQGRVWAKKTGGRRSEQPRKRSSFTFSDESVL